MLFRSIEIDPCIPSTLKEYKVRRVLRDASFDITIKNPDGRQSGVRSIVLDGSAIDGTIITATPGHHVVEVTM